MLVQQELTGSIWYLCAEVSAVRTAVVVLHAQTMCTTQEHVLGSGCCSVDVLAFRSVVTAVILQNQNTMSRGAGASEWFLHNVRGCQQCRRPGTRWALLACARTRAAFRTRGSAHTRTQPSARSCAPAAAVWDRAERTRACEAASPETSRRSV